MRPDETMYDLLAASLMYPETGFRTGLDSCRDAMAQHVNGTPCTETAGSNDGGKTGNSLELIERFISETADLSIDQMEEYYTRTFDINPVASLEVGWHLYGEQYERGAFLVRMRGMLREHGISESVELPDHLSHVLQLQGRMGSEEGREFARGYVLPALAIIVKGFDGKNNAYEHLLQAVTQTIASQLNDQEGDAGHE